MDRVKEYVFNNKDKLLKNLLITGAFVAAFNCLVKADYNVVSYLYIYYVWHMIEEKVFTYILFRILKLQKNYTRFTSWHLA